MRTHSLILLILLVTLSGCIVTYRDFPIVNPLPSVYEPASPPRCRQTVEFPGRLAESGTYQWTYEDGWSGLSVDGPLQDALQHYAGCSSSLPVVYNSTWAETKVVVRVLVKPSRYVWWGHGRGGRLLLIIGSLSSFPSIDGKTAGSCPTAFMTGTRSKDVQLRNYVEAIILAIVASILLD